tara:strand:+ start:689 stop:958 length:270 start_codon:yes stop_codon:yes gene_type:complete
MTDLNITAARDAAAYDADVAAWHAADVALAVRHRDFCYGSHRKPITVAEAMGAGFEEFTRTMVCSECRNIYKVNADGTIRRHREKPAIG